MEIGEEYIDPIIEVLTKERMARGWTQTEVGHKLGHVSGNVIYQWERGRISPRLPNIRAWAALFGLNIVTFRKPVRGRPRKDA